MSVPAGAGAVADQARPIAVRRDAAPGRASRQRAAVLAALPGDAALLAPALAKAAGVGAGVVQAMARDGLLASRAAGRSPVLAASRSRPARASS